MLTTQGNSFSARSAKLSGAGRASAGWTSATGAAISDLRGHEGNIFARTFIHSIFLTVLLGILVFLQQHVWPWMIPPH